MISRSPSKAGALVWLATILGASHLAFVTFVGRLRWEHVAADMLLVGLAWFGPRSRNFLRGALPLWMVGMLMDSQWLWLGLRGTIHTGDLWALEQALFPAKVNGAESTWPGFFNIHTTPVLDFLCGFAYAAYLAEVFLVAVFFFAKKSPRFEQLCWAFFVVNALGVATYMLYPAAPPWYVLKYGMGPADLTALPSAAGAARFDALFGISYFANFYARNPNVFGAMPSLHAAYPVLILWQVWHRGWVWRVGAAAFSALVSFSAIYLTHHYILDVTAGTFAALAACAVVDFAYSRKSAPGAAPLSILPGEHNRV
ncbi:phosphatase PAP2 family protein [Myxococcaceae bacterium GXIMD 01537]